MTLIAGVLASCATQTTPAATTSPAITTTTIVPADAAAAVEVFEACMTATGQGLDDIPLDAEGRPDLGALAAGTSSGSGFRQALTECAPILGEFLDTGESPGFRALVREQLVRYAQCMRASGVEDFPDPVVSLTAANPPFVPESIPTSDPQFPAAVEACASAVAASPAS